MLYNLNRVLESAAESAAKSYTINLKDQEKGFKYFKKAYEGGFYGAAYDYAYALVNGKGCKADPELAVQILETTQKKFKNAKCKELLDNLYQQGFGTDK